MKQAVSLSAETFNPDAGPDSRAGAYFRAALTQAPRRALVDRVAIALGSRIALFALVQAVAAAIFAARGHPSPWSTSIAWWPVTATIANLLSLLLLRGLLGYEGKRLAELVRIERSTWRKDVLSSLGLLAVGGVLAMVPNLGLATLLWGDAQAPLATFVQPLPLWAALVALVGFPVTVALSELTTYYGYARPRLESLGATAWQAVVLVAVVHALQHAALPLAFDVRFVVWRSLMFLPFALFVGTALRSRPRLFPYLMVAHGLLDASVGLMVLQAS